MLPQVHRRVSSNARAFNASRRRELICLSARRAADGGGSGTDGAAADAIWEFSPEQWPAYFAARAAAQGTVASDVSSSSTLVPDDVCISRSVLVSDGGRTARVVRPWDSDRDVA